ncbi:MAG: hypothetical protein WCJ51_01840 [Candidatus Moraniibacteriota bacterium]
MKKNFGKILLSLVFLASPLQLLAMSSTNFQINADAIDSGGGLSSSANYQTFDSIGEPFIGTLASTNFAIGEGLAPMVTYSLSLSLDSNSKNLGAVTAGTPISATTTASVVTDAWGGYDLYISENDDLKHTDATTTIPAFAVGTIATPAFWSGVGLGFTVNSGTGVAAKWSSGTKYAAIPTSSTLFHTKTGYKSGTDNTVVQYKLDVPTSQKAGNYSNTLTYMAVAKL